MKLRCLIVDDEFLARQLLEGYVQKVSYLEVAGLCESAVQAADVLQRQQIDLMFLDVNMPDLNGINFIKSLKHKPEVIITTAYSEHALEGYQLDVIEYLLKPIYFERFLQAVNKVKSQIDLQRRAQSLTKTRAEAPGLEGNSIFIKTGPQKITRINLPDILYIQSMHEYVRIHLKNESYTIYHPLKSLLDILPANQFIQIHRSSIINFSHITEIAGNTVKLAHIEVSIGKNFREEFISRIKSNSIGIQASKPGTKTDL